MPFPSPCGVWVVSPAKRRYRTGDRFRPLAGCGLFLSRYQYRDAAPGFRPLAGCGLFPEKRTGGITMTTFPSPCGVWVVSPNRTGCVLLRGFRPLAGWGCFVEFTGVSLRRKVSVPLRGVGCFCGMTSPMILLSVSVPLRGVGCFDKRECYFDAYRFPSSCGVWVVSNP